MTGDYAELINTYPHRDSELFWLHCAYGKHKVVERFDYTGIEFGRCTCGAIFYVEQRSDFLYPVWQKGLKAAGSITGAEERWCEMYYRSHVRIENDLKLLTGLGLLAAAKRMQHG